MPDGPAWLVMREGRAPRWGGEIRRRQVFARLAARTGALVLADDWSERGIRRATLGPIAGALPPWVPLPLVRGSRRPGRPRLATSEKLRDRVLDAAIALADPVAVAVYDDPVAQAATLGVPTDPAWLEVLARRHRRNREAFRWLVAPTASFGALAGLDPARLIVGGNGTVTGEVRPGPWPGAPTLGMVSAAAPGRGIELLVEAARALRPQVPGLQLRLWLVATNDAGSTYLAGLRDATAAEPWIAIASAPYDRLGEALAGASILVIPHPPGEYLDVALPVKLFDSLAAGRPLVVTPRLETAAVVRRFDVGAVAAGDRADDLAAAALPLLFDPNLARVVGARARAVAEREFDWTVVGDRIADEVLRREGLAG